jgi:hypothetical protein
VGADLSLSSVASSISQLACGQIPASEPLESDEVFVTTTVGGLMPVARVENNMMYNDRRSGFRWF